MNNQVFIQANITSEQANDEEILHNLIEAQVTQSLTDLETLIRGSSNLSNDKLFTITHNKDGATSDETCIKSLGKQNLAGSFNWLRKYLKYGINFNKSSKSVISIL